MSCDPGVLPGKGSPKSDSRNFFLSIGLSALFIVLCLALTMHSVAQSHSTVFRMAEPGWVSMPAGARCAYLGIHGGTVPVSLLATSTGNSLISFVGQTGNDFLELLRRGFDVSVGKFESFEIDFVARDSNELQYIQVAATVRDQHTLERELRPLRAIADNHPKLMLTLDEDPAMNYDGIWRMNALEWLMGKTQDAV